MLCADFTVGRNASLHKGLGSLGGGVGSLMPNMRVSEMMSQCPCFEGRIFGFTLCLGIKEKLFLTSKLQSDFSISSQQLLHQVPNGFCYFVLLRVLCPSTSSAVICPALQVFTASLSDRTWRWRHLIQGERRPRDDSKCALSQHSSCLSLGLQDWAHVDNLGTGIRKKTFTMIQME